MIPEGWKIKNKVSVNKYSLDPVEYAKRRKIPGGWNRQMEVDNTQYDAGRFERMRGRSE